MDSQTIYRHHNLSFLKLDEAARQEFLADLFKSIFSVLSSSESSDSNFSTHQVCHGGTWILVVEATSIIWTDNW